LTMKENRGPLHDLLESLDATDLRTLLTALLVDISQAALMLGVSEARVYQYTKNNVTKLTPVFGSSVFLKKDIEALVEVVIQKRKKHGTGKNRNWHFSQENVLKTLISLYKEQKADVELKDIVGDFETKHDMSYADISARVSFMLKKLMDIGKVKRSGRGLYKPLHPDKPVKEQLIVTEDNFPLQYGPFEGKYILEKMIEMGGRAKADELVDAIITSDYSREEAVKLVRGSLRKLMNSGEIERTSWGQYSLRVK
jgi:predicted transcriptional regulator